MPKRKLHPSSEYRPKFILKNGQEVDLGELTTAIEDNSYEIHWFFNSATGEVESFSEEYPSREQFDKDMEKIENDDNMHTLPKVESWDSYKFMENFNEDIVKPKNTLMYEKLLIALDGKGAFRRFKDVLHDDGELLEKWYYYKDEQLIREARNWLESLDIKFKII